MDFFDVIEKRHSVRAYKPDAVEKEKLDRILEAARLAPTAVNFQPFKIFVIATQGREEELKKIYKRDWFVQAPYILCVCAAVNKAWVRRDGRTYADVDCAIVMDHIILAATALGLGTCWIAAFDIAEAKSFLKTDDSMEPLIFTPLGYPAGGEFIRKRKVLDEIVEVINN